MLLDSAAAGPVNADPAPAPTCHHQADRLVRAQHAKDQSGDAEQPAGPAVESSHQNHLGSLREALVNFPGKAQTLVTRWNRGVFRDLRRAAAPRIEDSRGPVVRTAETVQIFLTAAEIDQLVGDHLSGTRVDELAKRYGVHRATVFAHLQRRNVPRRALGLDEAEAAHAVRLYRSGTSIRAVAGQIGADRKTVRSVLEVAGISIRSA